MSQHARANQDTWEYHRNVDRNASPAPNAHRHRPVSISSAKILALEPVAGMLTVV